MVYCSCNMLNMFRALLCPSSGTRDNMCVITAYGVQYLVAGCRGSGAEQQAMCPGRGMLHDEWHSSFVVCSASWDRLVSFRGRWPNEEPPVQTISCGETSDFIYSSSRGKNSKVMWCIRDNSERERNEIAESNPYAWPRKGDSWKTRKALDHFDFSVIKSTTLDFHAKTKVVPLCTVVLWRHLKNCVIQRAESLPML